MTEIDKDITVAAERRRVRRRSAGDGKGIDVGIVPGAYLVTVGRYIDSLSDETKLKLLEHVRGHVDEALKPLVRLLEKNGADEHQVKMFRDVGPNCLRTVMEHLEDAVKTEA